MRRVCQKRGLNGDGSRAGFLLYLDTEYDPTKERELCMSDENPILTERRGKQDGILWLTLNRPEKLNALTFPLLRELREIAFEARFDRTIRCVVLTGAGRGFCSGTDLTYTGDLDVPRPFAGRAGRARTRMLCAAWVYHCEKPTIAAVNGVCVGAGLSLALACDIRVASTESKFSSIFIKRAISPDTGTSWLLPRLIGMENALKMCSCARLLE